MERTEKEKIKYLSEEMATITTWVVAIIMSGLVVYAVFTGPETPLTALPEINSTSPSEAE